tara:strand:+ start:1766 stop:2038 length:273 start_codon:yes stop_codon:yes gene_type:complete
MIQLFVTGVQEKNSNRKTFVINELESEDTIRSLKLIISNKFNIPYNIFYLIYSGKTLNDKKILSDYNLKTECTIRVIFRAGSTKPLVIKD